MDQLQAHAGSAPQAGSAQQLVAAEPQQSLPRRLWRAERPRPRRRGSQQLASAAQQAGSAAPQAGSAAQQAGSAAHSAPAPQLGSAAQVGPQSQLVRPRRPRPAAEAESAATKPTTRSTTNIGTIEEKRFMENLLEGTEPNRSPRRN